MSDRLSIQRSVYDCEPPDKPAHLISFIIRGERGGTKGHACVDRRMARIYWLRLGELLGEPTPDKESPDAS